VEEKTATAREVNRLYWDTESSVAEISNKLGVSRRGLYELIEPMAAGVECNSCGAELYYGNRSAKAAATARCLVCGAERTVDDAPAQAIAIPPYGRPARRILPDIPDRAGAIAGFAIAGMVLGAIVTLLARRKR
jgi:hypothetical protein